MTTNSLVLQNNLAMAVANPGSMGSIEAYISAVNRIPLLSPEQEQAYGDCTSVFRLWPTTR